jgi:hypothetical protein
MAAKPHNFVPMNPSLVTSRNEGNSGAMKTKVVQSAPSEKFPPRLARKRGDNERDLVALLALHLLKHRNEIRAEWELSNVALFPLGAETNNHAPSNE